MFKVTKEITFDMGHRLSEYQGKCFNLHGHTYKLQVSLSTENQLDKYGFVIDFTDLKQALKEVTDKIDHKTMVNKNDLLNQKFIEVNPTFFVQVDFEPTAENISKYLYEELKQYLGWHLDMTQYLLDIKLWETPTSFAEYA